MWNICEQKKMSFTVQVQEAVTDQFECVDRRAAADGPYFVHPCSRVSHSVWCILVYLCCCQRQMHVTCITNCLRIQISKFAFFLLPFPEIFELIATNFGRHRPCCKRNLWRSFEEDHCFRLLRVEDRCFRLLRVEDRCSRLLRVASD